MSNFKRTKAFLIALFRRTHPTKHHSAVWTWFETCLDARSFTAAPFICIFGLARLFFFNEGSGDGDIITGLSWALLIHRIGWVPLLALGYKYPKLCRFYHYYEMLAMVLDSMLSLSGSITPAAHNFVLMYILLMNALNFCVFYHHIWFNFIAVILHAFTIKIVVRQLYPSFIAPIYQQVAFLVIEVILVLCVHLIVTRIGFWYI